MYANLACHINSRTSSHTQVLRERMLIELKIAYWIQKPRSLDLCNRICARRFITHLNLSYIYWHGIRPNRISMCIGRINKAYNCSRSHQESGLLRRIQLLEDSYICACAYSLNFIQICILIITWKWTTGIGNINHLCASRTVAARNRQYLTDLLLKCVINGMQQSYQRQHLTVLSLSLCLSLYRYPNICAFNTQSQFQFETKKQQKQ